MAESETHKRLKIVACGFLKKCCTDIVSVETKFRNLRSVADVCGMNLKRKEVRIVEVKASLKDYKRDKKLFQLDKSYYPHCNYFYIMCPKDVIPKELVLKEIGLLYVDENNKIEIVQKPTRNTKLKTRFDTTLKNSCRSITNDLIYKYLKINDFVDFLKWTSKKKKK